MIRAAAPQSGFVGDEKVPVRRLDRVLPETVDLDGRRTFLKLDVQGYERAVLDGAEGLFRDGVLVGVQTEMSLVPLYEALVAASRRTAAATAYCQSHEFSKALSFHKIDRDDITGAIPTAGGSGCKGASCDEFVAIECTR